MTSVDKLTRNAFATVLLSSMVIAVPQAGFADEGKAVLDRFVSFADASSLLDFSYAGASRAGSVLEVDGIELVISMDEVVGLFTTPFDLNLSEFGMPVDFGNYRVTIPTVTLEGLVDRGATISIDAFNASEMQMGFDVQGPGSTRETYRGIAGVGLEMAKWPDIEISREKPFSPINPLLLAMSDVDLNSLTIQSVQSTSILEDGLEMAQSYGPVLLGPTVGGDVTTVNVSNLAMSTTLPDGVQPIFELAARSMSARDYNSGTVTRALFSMHSNIDAGKTALGRLEINDLVMSVPEENASVSIDRLEVSDIGVTPPSKNIGDLFDKLFANLLTDDGKPHEQDVVELLGAIYGAFSLGRFEIADVRAQTEELEDLELASFVLADLSADGLGEISVNGLKAAGVKGEDIRVGRYALEDMRFPPLAALLDLERATEESDVAAILLAIPTLDRIVQEDVVLVIPNEGTDVSFGTGTFEMFNHVGPIPTGLRFAIEELQVQTSALDPEERETFEALDLDRLLLSADALLEWQRETSSVGLNFQAVIDRLGAFSGEGIIGNIPAVVFDQPNQVTVFALLGATLESVSARFEDSGLVERAIAAAADEEGIDYQAMELRLKGMIPVLLSELDDVALAADIANALTAVIESGMPVSFTARAAPPLPLAALGSAASDPRSLVGLFDIEIENR